MTSRRRNVGSARRLLPVVVVLLAAACGGGENPGGSKPPKPVPRNWAITIGFGSGRCSLTETGVAAPEQRLSITNRNWVVWQSDKGQPLSVVLHVPKGCSAAPFKGAVPGAPDPDGTTPYKLGDGSDDTIFSGKVGDGGCPWPPDPHEKEIGIDYSLIVGSDLCSKNGRIIIQP